MSSSLPFESCVCLCSLIQSTDRLPHLQRTSLPAGSLNYAQNNQLHASELFLDIVRGVPGGNNSHLTQLLPERRLCQDVSSAVASLGRQVGRLPLTSRPKCQTPPRPGWMAMESPRTILCPPAVQREEGGGNRQELGCRHPWVPWDISGLGSSPSSPPPLSR